MSDDLARFQSEVGGLLAGMADPNKLKAINKSIAEYLKKSTRERVKQQQEVDGSAFVPRKQIIPRTAYQRHASQRKLLINVVKAAYLKSKYSEDRLEVGYSGRLARLAREHNEGVVQRMKNGHHIVVPSRHYLGLSDNDWAAIKDIVIAGL